MKFCFQPATVIMQSVWFSLLVYLVVPAVGKTDINLQTHSFIVPKKEIKSPEDIASKWEKSEVMRSNVCAAYVEMVYKLYVCTVFQKKCLLLNLL